MTQNNLREENVQCYILLSLMDRSILSKLKKKATNDTGIIFQFDGENIFIVNVNYLQHFRKLIKSMGRISITWKQVVYMADYIGKRGWSFEIDSFPYLKEELLEIKNSAEDNDEYVENAMELIFSYIEGGKLNETISYSNVYFTPNDIGDSIVSIKSGMDIFIEGSINEGHREKLAEFFQALKDSFKYWKDGNVNPENVRH